MAQSSVKKRKNNRFFDDRVSFYIDTQSRMSPANYFLKVRWYLVVGVIVNIIATVFIARGILVEFNENTNSELKLIRTDGTEVNEVFDIRREVLVRNSLHQSQLRDDIREDRLKTEEQK
jgi:hypothetical protein